MPRKSGLEDESKLEQWKHSGQNGAFWCREQNIQYCVFLYWKKKLNTTEQGPPNFLELVASSRVATGIEIEFQGVLVRLAKDFDEKTFQRCALLLRGL